MIGGTKQILEHSRTDSLSYRLHLELGTINRSDDDNNTFAAQGVVLNAALP